MPDETPTPTIDETPKTDDQQTPPAETPKESKGKVYTEAELKDEVERRLKSQKSAIEAAQAKERKQQEDAALAQQGEYQKLAEERQQRIGELERQIAESETVTSQRDRYKGTLAKFLAKEREGLPAHILKLLDRMDEADQLDYIAENADDLKPAAAEGSNANGAHVPPSPKAAERGAISDAERQRRREQVARQVRAAL
jgi:hypothetical protein